MPIPTAQSVSSSKTSYRDVYKRQFLVSVPQVKPESGRVRGDVRRLTSGDYDHGDFSFSPDGGYLAVTAMRFEDADFMEKQDLWLIEVPTGRMVQVLEGEGHLGCPRWSPDGSKIAFVGTDGSHGSSTTNNLWVLPVEGFLEQIDKRESFSAPTPLSMCDARNLTREMDRPVGNFVSCDMSYIGEDVPFAWIDDNSLFLLVCDKGATGLYEAVFNQDSVKYEATRLWSDPLKNALALRVGGNRTLLQIGSPSQTDNLYLLNRDEKGSSLSVLYCLLYTSHRNQQIEFRVCLTQGFLRSFSMIPILLQGRTFKMSTWLINCRLIDGTGSRPKEGMAIEIHGSKIGRIVSGNVFGDEVMTGPQDQVVDLGGKTVIPGLWDSHMHLTFFINTRCV